MNDVEKRVSEQHEDLKQVVDGLEKQLAEKSEEIMSIRESKESLQTDKVKATGKKLSKTISLMPNLLV